MDGKVGRPERSRHLMCTTPFWGVAGALACGYFSYVAYAHLRDGDFPWWHDWESILTAGIWILLILGLLSETRCWRERTFFGLLFLNFTMAFGFAVWKTAPISTMRGGRQIALGLWVASGLASLLTLATPRERGALPVQKEN